MRPFSVLLFCLLLHPAAISLAAPRVELKLAEDLSAVGAIAKQKRLPIVLSVAQAHCPFCEKLKAEILRPMLISGDYADKAVIRELLMDSWRQVKDFSGRDIAAADVAARYKVWVTPTLLFLSPDGKELAPRILGINTVEMFSYYVDDAIDKALGAMQGNRQDHYQATPKDIGAWPAPWDDLSD